MGVGAGALSVVCRAFAGLGAILLGVLIAVICLRFACYLWCSTGDGMCGAQTVRAGAVMAVS